ncbi:hypothetical protein HDV02_001263 [Globomyces sp. JEL0801]|nr:hypothetical protein HDV02_001263 [Globomyces sp. JEL0801]
MADCIMVNRNGILDEIPIQYQGSIRFFEYKKQRYLYRRDLQCYKKQESKLKSISPSKLRSLRFGHTTNDSNELKLLNGPNRIVIDNIPITTHLLIKCTHPFYVFQMASLMDVGMGGGYVTYAILIFVMSVTSVTWEIYSLKVNEYQLKMMVEDIADFKVIRDKKVVTVGSDELVIGDAVLLEYTGSDTGIKLPCDMALIQGECVVDESSLTGETIPIRKLPIPPTRNESETIFDIDRQRGQVLFGGSYVTELKPKKFETVDITTSQSNQLETHDQTLVVAIVLSTGFSTSKGQLFQSILFPSEIEFKFNRDSMKFLKMLGCVAFLAFLNRLVSSILHHERLWDTVFTSLDLITIAVPPALPLILTVGIGFSIQRLKLLKIFCIDPERLNFAGRLDTMCWDKTGTLTVSNLIFAGVDRKQQEVEVDGLKFHHSFILNENSLERLMITCHGLNQQGDKLTGHALDIEQFQQTGWNVHNRNHTTNHLGFTIPVLATFFQPNFPSKFINLIKRYEFDAHLQRSSVIIQSESENQLIMYSKGSPESIKSVCRVDTIPSDFENVCNQYSIEGYYVIACAGKPITTSTDLITSLDRNEVEENLNFMGFMLFQNPIKSESRQVFNQLRLANVKPIIITGDNALTAIHVARHLNMCKLTFLIDFKNNELCFSQIVSERGQMDIELSNTHLSLSNPISRLKSMLDDIEYPELSITSLALQELIKSGDLDLLEYLMPLISIFARAKPDQKTWIIEWLIKHGTNDCGALKAAHVGVALSTAEASIVAPFTSANKNVMDGGALSVLASIDIGLRHPILKPQFKVITFGQSRIGNQAYVDWMKTRLNLERVIAYGDVVPLLPPEWQGYRHGGVEYMIRDQETVKCVDRCENHFGFDFSIHAHGYYDWNFESSPC